MIITGADSLTSSGIVGSIYVLLNQGNGTFGSPTRFAAGTEPFGFTVVDVNGDGNPDLVVAGRGSLGTPPGAGAGVAVLFGDGRGGFSSPSNYATPAGPAMNLVVGDFNNDKIPDIAVATGASITVFLGAGNGTFGKAATYPSGGDSVYLAMGDFNGDGKLDLASSNYNEQTVSVLLNNGSGGFLAPVNYLIGHAIVPESLVVTDFNNDGVPDIVGATGEPDGLAGNSHFVNSVDVLLGNGDGTFQAPQITQVGNSNPIAFAAAGDYNGDKKTDIIAMAQHSTSLLFYAGHGDNTFAAPVTSNLGSASFTNAIGAVSGDFNGDGVADVAVLTVGGAFAIALSQKNGSFQPLNTIYSSSAMTISSLALGDFNGDGKLDIAAPVL